MGENKQLNINWSKFKSNTKGGNLKKAKNGYVEFCRMLNELDFELVSDYGSATDKVELKYKFSDNVKLNIKPITFKKQTYNNIINFKNKLKENNDEFIKFVGLTNGNSLIAKIKTFDGGVVEIDIANYSKFVKARQDFYNKLKEVNGYTTDFYKGKDVKVNIYIDNVKLNPLSSNTFKRTYKNIISFKEQLKRNNDEFIKFVRLNNNGNFIVSIKTFDGGTINMDVSQYKKWNEGRWDFYNKLKEVDGYTLDYYKGSNEKINIFIDDVKLNLMKVNDFKRTYNNLIAFKNNLKENNDEFIKFTKLTKGGNLIAKIKTFDGGIVEMDFSAYNSFNKSRQDTYDYCEEKRYKVLSSYISSEDKMLIDFNCGHDAHWIVPASLKQGHGCPICNESRGERVIRLYLESNNIEFKQEYRFVDCRHKRELPFDFYIPQYNLCIEFDGIQHYKTSNFFGGEIVFKNTKIRDRIKNKYCKENRINLLRIPYYKLDNVGNILDKAMS
ncbi:TPA: hypothetical protein ACF2DE_002804 [Clostridium perfringens]